MQHELQWFNQFGSYGMYQKQMEYLPNRQEKQMGSRGVSEGFKTAVKVGEEMAFCLLACAQDCLLGASWHQSPAH